MPHTALQPETIQKLGTAAYPAFAMIAGMQLDLFTPLAAGPMSAEQLAAALNVAPARLTPLLYALVAAKLLTVEQALFANTPEADEFLVKGKPTYLGGRHAFYTARYQELQHTAASIRADRPLAKLDFGTLPSDAMETYLRGLHPATKACGRMLASRWDFSRHRHLLDVGGGSGGLATALCAAHPSLRATVLEMPIVAPIAQRLIAEENMTEHVRALVGDAVQGSFDGRYDVAVLRSFFQVLSPAQAQQALKHVFQVLEPGSPVFILGKILDDSRLAPEEAVTFNLVFVNIYDEGRAHTEREYREWLTQAGFEEITRVVLAGGESLVTARKPAWT
ncbi:methyltransferase [Paludibacterium purpuratum]|uniref:Ubiquinone/menaquinone biosynthesis C-methylase UbiE n=1 Tax=Paludibacterium purpuratum TaxID=1144873 RepID=A0A4R7AXK1_9NEIS|nr:methyltransferase [Paludibacterium purpuratum]TDR72023.1 ubiquinone/menaquinone biosynthesis C-methylase UbiE [Paludibacterium purpuratum]